MKRQTDPNIASRVYSYGAVPARILPARNEEAALDQMRLANRLWNALVAIEHTRTERYKKIMHDEQQDRIETLKAQAEALRDEIKQRRKKARKRSVDIDDLKDALGKIKSEMSILIETRKLNKEARHEAKKTELTALTEKTKHRVKRARQAAGHLGLFWGTYNDIVQRADAARKLGGKLKFRSFRGTGTLTAQIIGGALPQQCVEGKHTFFQIDPAIPGQRSRWARMRIGSNKDLSPIWLEIPIVYHREIDHDIKSVSMTRYHDENDNVRWQLNVTLSMRKAAHKSGPPVAIDIGWRLMPDGVRVAYWAAGDTEHAQVLVPKVDTDRAEHASSLRSTCDRMRDEFLPPLAVWLDGRELNEDWKAKAAHLIQWKSGDRLARLIRWWEDNRIPGDEEIYEQASAWRKQYLHLSRWWRSLQNQTALRIREQYRIFAKEIAEKYGTVYMEEFDLREVLTIPEPETDQANATAGAHYRQIIGPGNFRMILHQTCLREGTRLVKIPAPFTTRVCHVCGHAGKWNQAGSVMHQCENCGRTWDQDQNAALNLLRMGLLGDNNQTATAVA